MFVTVIMPLADGHDVSQAVFSGLCRQTVSWTYQPTTRPAQDLMPRISEGLSRRIGLEQVLACNELTHLAGVVMMDRDVALANATGLERAINRLAEGVTMVHVRCKARYTPTDHMDIGCVVVEACKETLEDLRDVFAAVGCPAGCWCGEVQKMCVARKYVQEWLSDEQEAVSVSYAKRGKHG